MAVLLYVGSLRNYYLGTIVYGHIIVQYNTAVYRTSNDGVKKKHIFHLLSDTPIV